eukprot:COSAG04_NODE_4401_length_2119_cov_2.903465_2_plen_90_part_00
MPAPPPLPHRRSSSLTFCGLTPRTASGNLAAINSTAVDTAINMDAYVQDNKTEEAYVQMSGTYVNSKRLGIGVCPQKGEPWAPELLRFA